MIVDVDKKIKEVEKELQHLLSEKKRQEQLSDDKALAEWLHKSHCTLSHNAGQCGWIHEGSDWSESSHERYLKVSQKMLKLNVDKETAKEIYKLIKTL